MAKIYNDISKTFDEYLLIPQSHHQKCTPNNVDLTTPLAKFHKGTTPPLN